MEDIPIFFTNDLTLHVIGRLSLDEETSNAFAEHPDAFGLSFARRIDPKTGRAKLESIAIVTLPNIPNKDKANDRPGSNRPAD